MELNNYKVDVLYYINPHMIWVLVENAEEKRIHFEQIGVYGILPKNIILDEDCEMKIVRCEQWVGAAVLIMKKLFNDATEVWFSPTYNDNKISIFDDNIHKYGEIIIKLKSGVEVNLADEITKSGFALQEETLFHNDLIKGKVITKLNYVTTLKVITNIRDGYKTHENILETDWFDTLDYQTQTFQETVKLEAITDMRKLSTEERTKIEELKKNKLNDLAYCKNIDEESAGRASDSRYFKPLHAESLKKKLLLLQSQNPDLSSLLKPVSSSEISQNSDKHSYTSSNEDFIQKESQKCINYDNGSSNNRRTKKGKTKNNVNDNANLVAFGPAGLQVKNFSVTSQVPKEEKVEVNRREVTDKLEFETEKGKEDVYEKTDSEVNFKISNIEFLNRIKSKTINLSPQELSVNNVKSKSDSLRRKINLLDSSKSNNNSSKFDIDSDEESVSDLETKLGLYKHVRKDITQPIIETFENNVKNDVNVNPFKNIDGSISVFVDKLVSPILMVHTKKNNRIKPLSDLCDIPLGSDIYVALRNMSITKPMRPQTVSWPTILRGHSFFLIGPHDSGNTMGYLPAVCRLVNDFKNSGNFGLSCIIVCATSHAVSAVESICKMFLHTAKIFACFVGINDMTITTTLLNGCDILICTPPMLVRLIQEDFSLDFRNLSTLVIDDCEYISEHYANELKFCLLKVREIVKVRVNKEWKVQYVVVSRNWCDFMESLAKKTPDTVICISAFEECVLYSKAHTSVEFLVQEKKVNSVVNFLKDTDTSKKTVIVCRTDEEVRMVEKTLTRLKYVVFSCDSTMTVQDLYNLDLNLQDYKEPVLGLILVCCDGNLTHLNITDAHYLIHYSLPTLYSMFCKRFSVLIDNYPSIFKNDECQVKIKIFIDDDNVEQLPKILHFVKRCTSDIPPFLNDISDAVLSEKDLKKAENLVPICNRLLTLGRCPDFWNCLERHTVFKEYDDPKTWMPNEGLITFKILHYHSAVHYSARLTSNITKSSTTKYTQTYNLLSLKMGMYYSKEENRKLHGIPKVGDVCAVTLQQNLFIRCKVMRVLRCINNKPNLVLIKLIDEEKYETARDTWLYYIPNNLKDIETHVVNVILGNITPKDKDVTYSKVAERHLKNITDENDDLYMRGNVTLVVGNIIFVDNLESCQDLSSLEEVVVKHDFKQLLEDHAVPNPSHIDDLRKLCGYTINEPIEIPNNDMQKSNQIKPKERWAHLENDDFTSVLFMSAESPDQFFVRLIKFDQCCNTMIKDIAKHVEHNPGQLKDINVGDIVLAQFPDDNVYERARIEKVNDNNTAECFFVDQGDWRRVSNNKILPIPDKFVTVLPFQAIECRLIGIKPVGDSWTDFSTNFLVDSCYNADNKLKQLYAKYFIKEKALVTEGHKYGIILVDTYNQDTIINCTMAENMLAAENNEINFDDITFDDNRPVHNNSDSDTDDLIEDKISLNGNDKNTLQLYNKPSNNLIRSVPLVDSDDSLDDFEFVTDNSGKIGSIPISEVVSIKEMVDTDSTQPEANSAVINTKITHSKSEEVPIKTIHEIPTPKADILDSNLTRKPRVTWRQNITTVTVKIQLIVDNYEISIKQRNLEFSAVANDTNYGFDLELFGVIDIKKSSHCNKGQYILVKLWKMMVRNWLTLTRANGVAKWIVYDVDSIEVSSDDESNIDVMDAKHLLVDQDDNDSDDFDDDITFSYKKD